MNADDVRSRPFRTSTIGTASVQFRFRRVHTSCNRVAAFTSTPFGAGRGVDDMAMQKRFWTCTTLGGACLPTSSDLWSLRHPLVSIGIFIYWARRP